MKVCLYAGDMHIEPKLKCPKFDDLFYNRLKLGHAWRRDCSVGSEVSLTTSCIPLSRMFESS